tara:strand:- start:3167 stop:3421 length:255 start_codon:yes stop_codon:yes gene_type:complete
MYVSDKIKFIDNTGKKDEFYCKICTFPFLSFSDFEKQKEYGCCYECYLKFAESRKKEWLNGWRPDKNVVKEYIKIRKQLNKRNI